MELLEQRQALSISPVTSVTGLVSLSVDGLGTLDGAVASMKGVAVSVSPDIHIYDLTHNIEPFNIWQGALRLVQTAEYWPAGTVFVSVVDPGVGTNRKSIVLKTKSGHYFVTPDNGTLTFVAPRLGIEAVREIDEAVNRRINNVVRGLIEVGVRQGDHVGVLMETRPSALFAIAALSALGCAHAPGRDCFRRHLEDAIALNEARRPRYAALSGGASLSISDELISTERVRHPAPRPA